jgi:hypothetical protein
MIWFGFYLIPGIMLALGCAIFDDKDNPKLDWASTLGLLLMWPFILYLVYSRRGRG